jgi:D-amino peptidase
MIVYISCDLEGVAGICDWDYAIRGKMDYEHGRKLMLQECNAAIEGAFDAGAKRVVVNDSHNGMINLLPEDLHPEAELIAGRNKTWSMMHGIDSTFDAAVFVGYHAGAGALRGTLAHTYSSRVQQLAVNNIILNEAGINAFYAGTMNVPVVALTGDDILAKEMKQLIPDARTIVVKKGMGRLAAWSIHPSKARELIREGVGEALKKIKVKPFSLKAPYTLKVVFDPPQICDMAERMPGIERLNGNTVVYKTKKPLDVYKAYMTLMTIAAGSST